MSSAANVPAVTSFPTTRRLACDRCRSHKLRCPPREDRSQPCTRCIYAKVECATGYSKPLGRAAQAAKSTSGRPKASPRTASFPEVRSQSRLSADDADIDTSHACDPHLEKRTLGCEDDTWMQSPLWSQPERDGMDASQSTSHVDQPPDMMQNYPLVGYGQVQNLTEQHNYAFSHSINFPAWTPPFSTDMSAASRYAAGPSFYSMQTSLVPGSDTSSGTPSWQAHLMQPDATRCVPMQSMMGATGWNMVEPMPLHDFSARQCYPWDDSTASTRPRLSRQFQTF